VGRSMTRILEHRSSASSARSSSNGSLVCLQNVVEQLGHRRYPLRTELEPSVVVLHVVPFFQAEKQSICVCARFPNPLRYFKEHVEGMLYMSRKSVSS
jgi:hypothetical protein